MANLFAGKYHLLMENITIKSVEEVVLDSRRCYKIPD